jgi:hypothetical protein
MFDCACFAFMFLAVGAPLPWKGLLLAYGAGQLAATLPITPGGLGVVEGSITIALELFGGAHNSTTAAVLLYRLISFWLVLLVGWSLWGVLALQVRRGRWNRFAMDTPVVSELGPGAGAAGEPLVGGIGADGSPLRAVAVPGPDGSPGVTSAPAPMSVPVLPVVTET